LKEFSVNIIGLSQKSHQFNFHLNDGFFDAYQNQLFSRGDFEAIVNLDKHETFIDAQFKIKGTAELICDRTLDTYTFPIQLNEKIIFKYGEEEGELSEEIVVITRDKVSLDIGQYLHEFITLAIPMKKLHPRFNEGDDEQELEGKLVYTSSTSDKENDPEMTMDPRWEQLKKVTIKK
jgi:uncharacterized protein